MEALILTIEVIVLVGFSAICSGLNVSLLALDLAELRSLQDWYLRYALTAVPGVSDVASVGGFEKQYQVDIDPAKLLAYGIPVTRVMTAIRAANDDVGAMTMELAEREYKAVVRELKSRAIVEIERN